MTTAQGKTDYKTIRINGKLYPCSSVRISELGTFIRRITQGPADKDTDDYISSYIMSDFTGGGQVLSMKESTDTNRYLHGTAETRYPGQITLSLLVTKTRPDDVPEDALFFPIGVIGTQFYGCWAQPDSVDTPEIALYGFNEASDTWYATDNVLTAPPVGESVWFQGMDSAPAMFIPQGEAGYAWATESDAGNGTLAITEETGSSTVPKAVDFELWDNRLWAISTDGVLFYTFEGQDEAEWQTLEDNFTGAPLQLNQAETPRHLIAFYDRAGNSTLHLQTDHALYWLNIEQKTWESTNSRFPAHPDNGLAATVWRTGEDLWVNSGVGVMRTTPAGAIVPKAGLDRDNGLPIEFRGSIRSFCPEWSSLYALVQGNPDFEDEPDTVEDGIGDDESYLPIGTARSLLCAYSGTGWHPIWESEEPVESVSWLTLSNVPGGYRLWWGAGPDAYTIRLRKDFYNPREGLKAGLDDFNTYDYLITSRFDANMEGFTKLASRLVVRSEQTTTSESITISYQTDADPSDNTWHLLGTVTAPGHVSLPFNEITLPDGSKFSEGISFNWIAFKFEFRRGANPKRTPLLDTANLHYTKIPQNVTSLVATIPIPQKWNGRDGAQIARDIKSDLTFNKFVQVEHQNDLYRCQVAGVMGVDTPGQETTGTREVHLLEIDV